MYISFAFNIYDTTFVIFSSLDNFVFIFRIAKLKGITTEKPDPPSDSSDEDEDDEDGATRTPAKPAPPPVRMVKSPPPSVKSPPSGKRKTSSIMSPTKSQKSLPVEPEKWIDYREFALMLQQ